MTQTPITASVNMGDRNANRSNFTHYFNNFSASDEDAPIRSWLSPLEPTTKHKEVCADRVDGIGDWLLETSEFREWRQGGGGAGRGVLLCSGNPGVGKTYLSSLVIDRLRDQAKKGDISVAGLYYDFATQQEQTTTNVMGAILKQFLSKGNIPEYLREASRVGFGDVGIRLPGLMELLKKAIVSLPQVFICIDALDQCLQKHRLELLESLRDIVREFPKTRIFLTGRTYVTETIQGYFTNTVVIPISPNTGEIRSYLEKRLKMENESEAMSEDLWVEIIETLLDKMSDAFLLAPLIIDSILAEVTLGHKRKKLEELARSNMLTNAYTPTLTLLKAQGGYKSTLGMRALMWVLYSERPLRVEELRHALGVEIRSANLDPEIVPTLPAILESCLGLVTVEASSSTVQLVHPTLHEHLLSDPTLFHSPQSTIAEVCLTYLNLRCRWDPPPAPDSATLAMPFQEYASCYWRKHAGRGTTENVEALALMFLNRRATQFGLQLLG